MSLEITDDDHLKRAVGYLHALIVDQEIQGGITFTPQGLLDRMESALDATRQMGTLDPLSQGMLMAGGYQQAGGHDPKEKEAPTTKDSAVDEPSQEAIAGTEEEGGLEGLDPAERAAREAKADSIERSADARMRREAEAAARARAEGGYHEDTQEGEAAVEHVPPEVSVEAQSQNVLTLVECDNPQCHNKIPSTKGKINGLRLCVAHEPQAKPDGSIDIEDL